MSGQPQKAGSKKSASKSKKAGPPSPSTSKKAEAKADGVELARLRRLARAGVEPPGRCALLGVLLDVGPRANHWRKPVQLGDEVVSQLGAAILDSGVSSKSLGLAEKRLRARSKA